VAAHAWTTDDLAEYLSTGWHRLHGAAAGPMADVTSNLGRASSQNVRAIAVYIASLSARTEPTDGTVMPQQGREVADAPAEVVSIYRGACAGCHNDRNDVGPSKAISLSLSTAVRQPESMNAVRVVRQGIRPQPGIGGAYMPAFDGILTDQQITSVVEYVRARYTNQPPWTDVREALAKAKHGGVVP
jgi:mono/diheme cytochrome c family protein